MFFFVHNRTIVELNNQFRFKVLLL